MHEDGLPDVGAFRDPRGVGNHEVALLLRFLGVLGQEHALEEGEIHLIELPEMRILGWRRVKLGRPLLLFAFATSGETENGENGAIELEAVYVADDGHEAPVEELGARWIPMKGRAVLLWRPTPAQVGTHVFTFTATTRARLSTSHSVRVEVLP